ncbi:hypothetical protein G6F24_016280 [Rhizopus arrhizus]|nr:hypothetical protein G6F24_016280 [Rhizopus arrhizus]
MDAAVAGAAAGSSRRRRALSYSNRNCGKAISGEACSKHTHTRLPIRTASGGLSMMLAIMRTPSSRSIMATTYGTFSLRAALLGRRLIV